MTGDIIFQLVLLAAVVALFASDRVRPDAVALGLILVLMISGQLTAGEAVSGFGDPLVLMIAGLFVVGEGLSRTGVAHALGGMLVRRAGGSEVRMLVSLMGVVAVLSAFMSSTGAVAVFIPVTLTLARRTGTPVERLLMPLSIAALLGGMLTLIGTPPNLVVSAELQRTGQAPFGFFDFLPIGLAVLVACTLWIVVVGRRQLVGQVTGQAKEVTEHIEPTIADLADRYGKLNTTRSFRVTETSPLVGHTPAMLEFNDYMPQVDIEKRKQASAAKDSGPWVDWPEEMAVKTVIKHGLKLAPASVEDDSKVSRYLVFMLKNAASLYLSSILVRRFSESCQRNTLSGNL